MDIDNKLTPEILKKALMGEQDAIVFYERLAGLALDRSGMADENEHAVKFNYMLMKSALK